MVSDPLLNQSLSHQGAAERVRGRGGVIVLVCVCVEGGCVCVLGVGRSDGERFQVVR